MWHVIDKANEPTTVGQCEVIIYQTNILHGIVNSNINLFNIEKHTGHDLISFVLYK
jgi:hypothetical protein